MDAQTIQIGWTIVQGISTLGLGVVGIGVAKQNIALGKQNIEITKQNAAVAERNMAVTEQKSRLDHFAKRWDMYVAVHDFLKVCENNADTDLEKIQTFNRATRTAGFMFFPEVAEFIETVRKAAIALHVTRKQFTDPNAPAEKRSDSLEKNDKALADISALYKQVDAVFDPYLESRPTVRPTPKA